MKYGSAVFWLGEFLAAVLLIRFLRSFPLAAYSPKAPQGPT